MKIKTIVITLLLIVFICAQDIDKQKVQAFIDTLFADSMKKYNVPGGVIAIVHGKDVILSKGYGYADVVKQIPATSNTGFRVGSLSKLVTAAAAMQLVEKNQVDIHADIAKYLDVNIHTNYPDKVTLAHLLTHTSGFDVTDIGDAVRKVEEVIPLREFVAKYMTPQIYPPGKFFVYTNHGYALIGYLVEYIGKQKFADYVADNVFSPLGMNNSSFAQPLHERLTKEFAIGYNYAQGKYQALPVDFSNVTPADALVTTSDDFAKFMIAFIDKRNSKLLQQKTIEQMLDKQFSYAPQLAGRGYGFGEELFSDNRLHYGTRRAFSHTGGQLGFTSAMIIIPEYQVGMFIVLNRRVGKMRREIFEKFLQEFFPHPQNKFTGKKSTSKLEVYTGLYQKISYPQYSLEKIGALLDPGSTAMITAEDGRISSSKHGVFYEQEPDVFRNQNDLIVFRKDAQKNVTHFSIEQVAYQKIAWYQSPRLHLLFLLGAFFLFLLSIPLLIIEWWRKKSFPKTAKFAIHTTNLTFAMFLVLFIVEIIQVSGSGWDYGFLITTYVLLTWPIICVFVVLMALTLVGIAIYKRLWSLGWYIYSILLSTCAIIFICIIRYWNLTFF
ncbi:serine hydrolase domain-containing protein [Candidatus Uabimicrobium amorphum]|uniref:Serine hydrolase n=1 Tax=Uabimicrobium amorphum TaxID=2596890 RepID=A0A5S9ISI5_UABAM|nr:serine hydrolase domain-containing protein [Candidatus Uabimicrobium amorphum]BBM85855.1 serine hydrolase [Candidatus Uabimicrobium amorphum]